MAYLWIFCIADHVSWLWAYLSFHTNILSPLAVRRHVCSGWWDMEWMARVVPWFSLCTILACKRSKLIYQFTFTIWFWKRSQVVYVVSSDLTPQGSYGSDRKKICTRGEFYCWFDIFDHWAKFYVGQNFAF